MTNAAALPNVALRGPEVAGRFYPADPTGLSAALDAACARAWTGWPAPFKAIIAPHAGLAFSGQVAASAYRNLSHAAEIRRVVILAPAHRAGFSGIAAPRADVFATPLAHFAVDADLRRRVTANGDVALNDAAFTAEHAIEMQLIFLARRAPQARILPLLVGDCTSADVAHVLDRVWGGPDTLIVVSSDLSHFKPEGEARPFDLATCAAIERLDRAPLDAARACGHRIISGLVELARRRDFRAVRLDLSTSADAGGDHQSVVGYPAYGFLPAREAQTPPQLRAELIGIAKSAIAAAQRTGKTPAIQVGSFPHPLQTHAASFVTLTLDGDLRGCVGSLLPIRSLVGDVADNAVRAAFQDQRFAPLTAEELARVEISVSILSHPRLTPARSIEELARGLEFGRDGLILAAGDASATFLPQVWSQLPNPAEFIAALAQKAGFVGWPDDVQAFRFVVEKF